MAVTFQSSGVPTIVAKRKTKCKLGQRDGFSDTDIRWLYYINTLYWNSAQEAEHPVPVSRLPPDWQLPDKAWQAELGRRAHLHRQQQVSGDQVEFLKFNINTLWDVAFRKYGCKIEELQSGDMLDVVFRDCYVCVPQVLRHLGQAGRVLPQLQVDAVPMSGGLWPVSGQVGTCNS